MDIRNQILKIALDAKNASYKMPFCSTFAKNDALRFMAKLLKERAAYILQENKRDLTVARKKNYSSALIDRLTLDLKRIEEMCKGLLAISELKDPVGEVIKSYRRPNGLLIKKIRTPLGVIGIIYESRPNVTSDCIGLCLKSGNAVILKGGSEAIHSNRAIFSVLQQALKKTSIPLGAVNFISFVEHKAVDILLQMDRYIDVIIPRGGQELVTQVASKSRIPVIKHYKGVCHTYVSDKADLDMAKTICYNAKVQRPGTCNAMETMLVNKNVAKKFLPGMIRELQSAGVEVRGCPVTRSIVTKNVKKATEKDWSEEYLDLILSVKVVNNIKEAVGHINTYGSRHSETIVTENKREAEKFLKSVDSACLYVNASTRFTDGFQFGMGAEIGISTDKLHARGPMALEELTTYKYLVFGRGQIRQ